MASPTVLSTGAKQHALRVARLYRHALKNIASWAVDRQLFWEEVRGGKRRVVSVGANTMASPLPSSFDCVFFFPSYFLLLVFSRNLNRPKTHTRQAEKLRAQFEANKNVSLDKNVGRKKREKEK